MKMSSDALRAIFEQNAARGPTHPVDGFEDHVGRFVAWREDATSPVMMGVVACRDPAKGWQIQIGTTFRDYEACNRQKKKSRRFTKHIDIEAWEDDGRLCFVDRRDPGVHPLLGGAPSSIEPTEVQVSEVPELIDDDEVDLTRVSDALFSMAATDARGEEEGIEEEEENGERDDPLQDEDALRTLVNAAASGHYLVESLNDLFSRLHRRAASSLGEAHPNTATALHNIALVYESGGRYEEALEHYERCLAVTRSALGEAHPDTAGALYNIARVYKRQGQFEKALVHFAAAARAYTDSYGSEHYETVDALAKASEMRALVS